MPIRHHELCDQAGFERHEREARNARIRHAAAVNPELALYLLAERFALTQDAMRAILGREDCARRARAQLNERECRRSRGPDSPQFNPWRKR